MGSKRPREASSSTTHALVLDGGDACPPGLIKLWKDRTLCDAHIIVDGETFHAHRCVLAATSDFFAALYRAGTADATGTAALPLADIHVEAFRALLCFLYTGRCELADAMLLTPLLEAASRLQVAPLTRAAIDAIVAWLSPEIVLDAWALAETLHLPELERAAKERALQCFEAPPHIGTGHHALDQVYIMVCCARRSPRATRCSRCRTRGSARCSPMTGCGCSASLRRSRRR